MSLSEMKMGKGKIIIRDLNCGGARKQRLIDLGLVRGAEIKIKGFAPFGDPMIIEVKDFCVAIRKSDANSIIIN